MPKDELLPSTLNRLNRGIDAFEKAAPTTRRVILAELLGTSAYVVEMTEHASKDAALNIVLAMLESKTKRAGGSPS